MRKPTIKTYRNKCDRLIQEIGREVYEKCLICGQPVSCLHHYYPKSTCTALRYDWDNLIPLCQGHHFSHHNGNPEIHNLVNKKKGDEWLERLTIKKHTKKVYDGITWYREMFEWLEEISKTPNKFEDIFQKAA